MRKERTATEIAELADRLETAARALRTAIDLMKPDNMPSILVHGDTQAKRYIPDILEWAEKVEVDARAQARAHHDGIVSRAHADKADNDRRKKLAREKAKK